MATSSPHRVTIPSEAFSTALHRYIEDYKPDPLAAKQLQGWSLEWLTANKSSSPPASSSEGMPEDGQISTTTTTTTTTDASSSGSFSNPAHLLQGNLEIGGEYLVVTLAVTCAWTESSDSPKHGTLWFSCHASARFWTKSEWKKKNKTTNRSLSVSQEEDGEPSSSSKKKAQDKIRAKMVQRLSEDAYVSKLLQPPQAATTTTKTKEDGSTTTQTPPATTTTTTSAPVLLAQARIQSSPNHLEERVVVSEDVCEALKRAIWSSAESPLDVIEMLLQLPCLPTMAHSSSSSSSSEEGRPPTATTTTPLADRAKLRLLEDAMCDACEKEGEDDMVGELSFQDTSNGKGEQTVSTTTTKMQEGSGSRKKAKEY